MSLALHAFTATGVLVGMAALVAVLDGSARLAIIWLLVAQLIDGIDGPLARRLLPEEATTKFDGYVLDLVIDFVTCVLVPAAFLWEFNMVNHDRSGMIAVAALLMFSSLWFSRTDQQDSDSWFHGFPASWNMVIPTLWLLDSYVDRCGLFIDTDDDQCAVCSSRSCRSVASVEYGGNFDLGLRRSFRNDLVTRNTRTVTGAHFRRTFDGCGSDCCTTH